ncbi:MAG: hypothetical protein CMI02_15100 [Oceanospirillaceae bacterium]|nr:hypothetical protein [Oceanospirillaceae bacterium]|tara:strand:+ start:977 stop:1492 length:516 start_codon:yes stop_codon:yes gene_type:complete
MLRQFLAALLRFYRLDGHTVTSLEHATGVSAATLCRWLSEEVSPSKKTLSRFMRWTSTKAFIRQNPGICEWDDPDTRFLHPDCEVILLVRPPSDEPGAWLLGYFLDGAVLDFEQGPWRRSLTQEMLLDELRESTAMRVPELIAAEQEHRERLLEVLEDDLEALLEHALPMT